MDPKDKQDFMNFIAQSIAEQTKKSSDQLTLSLNTTINEKMGGLEKQIKDISDITKTKLSKLGT